MKKQIKKILQKTGFVVSRVDKTLLNDDRFYANYNENSLLNKKFYNIGAGGFSHKYWSNVDYQTEHYRNIQMPGMIHHNLMDLSEMPIESNSAEIVYSSHTIEHISNDAVNKMIKECYRVLKPNGAIRLTTPNFKLYYDAYKRNDMLMWDWIINNYSQDGIWEKLFNRPLNNCSIEQIFLYQFASGLAEIHKDNSVEKKYSDTEIKDVFEKLDMNDAFDYFTTKCSFNDDYPGNHINWFTEDKLRKLLENAGFKNITLSAFGQSKYVPLRNTIYFDNTHPKYSIYIEANK